MFFVVETGTVFKMRPFRFRHFAALFGLIFGILAATACHSAYAESADRGIELLTRASRSYEAGAYRDAYDFIEDAFKAGLSGELAARGILLRAQVNEKSGAFARAFQDYSNALWMDSLSPTERKKAADGKARVTAAMGISPADAAKAAAATPAASTDSSSGGFLSGLFGSTETTAQPAPKPQSAKARPGERTASSDSGGLFGGLFGSSSAPEAAPQPAPRAQAASASTANSDTSSGSVFGFFNNVLGSNETKPQTPQAGPQKQVAAASAKPANPPKKTADQALVKVASANAKPTKVAPAAKPAVVRSGVQTASMQPVAGSETYMIVFGGVGAETSGRAAAQQIKAKVSDILVNRQLDVATRPDGGYQVQAGPYKVRSAALALCSAMTQRGVSCQVTP
jgi:hypothetical protein